MKPVDVLRIALIVAACLPVTAEAAAGRTGGAFAVGPDGAAAYTIPIWTPPGPNGVQPGLALTYNSRAGNGVLGVGWSLAGLSSIERCNSTVGQDGVAAAVSLNAADKFCKDGKRLRLTGGTYGQAGSSYQTEIADFSLVTANGTTGSGPTYFTVKAKNGWILEYGNTADSRVIPGSSASVLRWMLNKLTDRDGNAVVFSYNTVTGYAVPSSISWTRTSAGASTYVYTATFAYSTKSAVDTIKTQVAGQSVQNAQRLSSVTITSAASGSPRTVRKYVLAYETSATRPN